MSTLATTPAGTIRVLTTRGGSIAEFSTIQRTWYLRKISSRLLSLVASLKKSSRSAALSAWPFTKNSKSLFQKPYAVVRLRGRLYRNRSRYFAPVSRRSIN